MAIRAQDVRLERQAPGRHRKARRPQHTWRITVKPWEITPCLIAPVLAGDSLKAASWQFRTMSGPLASKVTGWWHEFFLFYVRLGDLEVADVMRDAIIDPTENMTAINAVADYRYYHAVASRPSWSYECMRTVVRAYFREEGEAWSAAMLNGYPAAQITGDSWTDSVIAASLLPAETGADDWEKSWSVYQGMRNSKLSVATFEEYLAMQGVEAPPVLRETEQDFRKAELIRFSRDFVYPVSTVDQTSGLTTGMVQWSGGGRADRKRFFDQPGFLFGVVVCRPKVYLMNQHTSASDLLLNNAAGWLPPQFDTEPHTSIIKVSGTTDVGNTIALANGPIHGGTTAYWMDRRDLFLRGDQFINVDMSGTGDLRSTLAGVNLPAVNLSSRKYPSTTDQDMLWADGAPNDRLQMDGIMTLNIASRIGSDLTVGGT